MNRQVKGTDIEIVEQLWNEVLDHRYKEIKGKKIINLQSLRPITHMKLEMLKI